MAKCPKCGGAVTPDDNNPGKFLCYNCMLRFKPEQLVDNDPATPAATAPQMDSFNIGYEEPQTAQPQYPQADTSPIQQVYPPQYAQPNQPPYEQPYGQQPPYATQPTQQMPYNQANQQYGGSVPPYTQGQYPPPYGQPAQMPGYPYNVPQRPQGPPSKALPIVALCLGIFTLLFSFIPVIGLSVLWLPGIAALACGITGVVKCANGTASGKGMAIAAIIIPIVAVGISIATTEAGVTALFGDISNTSNTANTSTRNSITSNSGSGSFTWNTPNGSGTYSFNSLDDEEFNAFVNSFLENNGMNMNMFEDMNNMDDLLNSTAPKSQNGLNGYYDHGTYKNDYFEVEVGSQNGKYEIYVDGYDSGYEVCALGSLSTSSAFMYGLYDDKGGRFETDQDYLNYLIERDLYTNVPHEFKEISAAGHPVTALFITEEYNGRTSMTVFFCKVKDGIPYLFRINCENEQEALDTIACVTRF